MTDTNAGPSDWEVGDALANGWETYADWILTVNAPVQRWMLEHLDPQPGDTVVELGAGPGDLGFEAARRIGDAGRLISTDVSPAMVDVARRRAGDQDVPNVEFRVMDAQSIDLDDDTVDAVAHRYGPMLLPDPDASFRHARRILRDGGRYAAAVFAGPQDNPWMTLLAMSAMEAGVDVGGADPMAPGGVFSMADADAFGERVTKAGFADVAVDAVDHAFGFEDPEDAWTKLTALSGALAMLISRLPDGPRMKVHEIFTAKGGEFMSDEGLTMPGRSLCVLAK